MERRFTSFKKPSKLISSTPESSKSIRLWRVELDKILTSLKLTFSLSNCSVVSFPSNCLELETTTKLLTTNHWVCDYSIAVNSQALGMSLICVLKTCLVQKCEFLQPHWHTFQKYGNSDQCEEQKVHIKQENDDFFSPKVSDFLSLV